MTSTREGSSDGTSKSESSSTMRRLWAERGPGVNARGAETTESVSAELREAKEEVEDTVLKYERNTLYIIINHVINSHINVVSRIVLKYRTKV